jgi:hypothetical protein
VLFDADVARAGLGNYASVVNGHRIDVVDDPVLGSRRQVMRFTVRAEDDQLTGNPRAQVETPRVHGEGDEVWVGWSTLFPSGFPRSLPAGGQSWLTFSEFYGPPYQGASPVHMGMRSGAPSITYQRNQTYAWDIPWERPLRTGVWYDFVMHVKLSSNASEGFVEYYVNDGSGWQQQQLGGAARLHMRTLDSSNGAGDNYHKLALYYSQGMYDSLTLYHAEHRVGTSFSAVAPHSHG